MNVPFSAAFGAAGVPGAFGIENFAKETGLNVAGFLILPTREGCLLSVRLASDSEPPCDPASSPPSDDTVRPFISSALVATESRPCLENSYVWFSGEICN